MEEKELVLSDEMFELLDDSEKNSEFIAIESKTFAHSGIKKIEIPSNILTIKSYAFSESRLLRMVILNEGLLTIEGNAFSGCKSLTRIDVP